MACRDAAGQRHVAAFKDFLATRVDSRDMARLLLYARHRSKSSKDVAAKEEETASACHKCGDSSLFASRFRTPRPRHQLQRRTYITRVCGLCRAHQPVTATPEAGSDEPEQRVPVTPVATEKADKTCQQSTPVKQNLQKLMSAKKRQSLNKDTGLLDFLIKSNS